MEIKNKNSSILLAMLCVFGISGTRCTAEIGEIIYPDQFKLSLRDIYRYVTRKGNKVVKIEANGTVGTAMGEVAPKITKFISKILAIINLNLGENTFNTWQGTRTNQDTCYERTYTGQPGSSLKVTVYLKTFTEQYSNPHNGPITEKQINKISKICFTIGNESITMTYRNPYDPPEFPDTGSASVTHIRYNNAGVEYIVNINRELMISFGNIWLHAIESN